MTDRSKTPTLREPVPPARATPVRETPTIRDALPPGRGAPPVRESIEDARTEVWEQAELKPPPQQPQAPIVPAAPVVRAVSKKTPGVVTATDTPPRAVPQVKLRALSDVQSGPHATPQALGYLAPPRDPSEVRARRRNDLLLWSSVCVIIACAVALVIWFVAR